MILIGQYDSPFVRRVGIALTLYGLPFEHLPWSTFSDVDKIQPYSPLLRVPVLVLDNGEALTDSHLILDYLDALVPPEKAMYPRQEPDRHRALKVAALACGISDKAVSLFYELVLHKTVSEMYVARCKAQISQTLAVLNADRAARASRHWFGKSLSHADIVVATMLRHLNEAHPGLIDMNDFTALKAHSERLESTGVFQTISQVFIPPS